MVLTVEHVFAGGGITGEADAVAQSLPCCRNHALHIHRGAPIRQGCRAAAIGDRAWVHPRAETGADRAPQLLLGVLRERLAGVSRDHVLCKRRRPDASPARVSCVSSVTPVSSLACSMTLLEPMVVNAQHHTNRHIWMKRDRGPRRTVDRLPPRRGPLPLRRSSKVEYGVHHPGMDTRAPERTDTSSGRRLSPNFRPTAVSSRASASRTCEPSSLR